MRRYYGESRLVCWVSRTVSWDQLLPEAISNPDSRGGAPRMLRCEGVVAVMEVMAVMDVSVSSRETTPSRGGRRGWRGWAI